MPSPCSADQAPTTSDLSGPDSEPLPSASRTPGAAQCSPSTGPESPATLTFVDSQALMFPGLSTSSPAASPARTSARLGRAQDSPESDRACGSSTCGSCPNCDPLGFSLKTSLLSALAGLTPWRLAWKRKATPSGRSWWVLGRSGLRTGESECGLSEWATPTTRDWRSTAASSETHDRNARPLSEQAGKDWPTPKTADGRAKGNGGDRKSPGLDQLARGGRLDAESPSTNGSRPGSLNPDWVETLQGLPLGWTDLPAETVSALWVTRTPAKSRKRSGGGS